MKKNIWIGVLVAAVMALALLVWFQGQQIAALKEQQQRMIELDREIARTARARAPAPVEEAPAPVAEAKPVEPVVAASAVPRERRRRARRTTSCPDWRR